MSTLSPSELDTLAAVAEQTLRVALAEGRRWLPDPAAYSGALRAPRAAFVSIHRDARLLGCIGVMESADPLVSVVADRTIAAAFHDPRTRGVSPTDFPHVELEVSVLSPMEAFAVGSYDELVSTVAGTGGGLLVEAGRHRATFLPSVWGQLDEPAEFVAALWQKAGLAHRAWPTGIGLWRYTADTAHSSPPRPALR